jgi:hypothetical protein
VEAVERILTPRSPMSSLGSDSPFPTGFRGLTPWYGQMSVLHLPSAPASAPPNAKPLSKPIVIGHSGSDGTIAWAFPDRDLMILYFTQSRGGVTPIRLEMEIDRLLLHPGAAETVDPALAKRFEPYVSRYLQGFSEVRVLVQNGHLALDLPDSLVFELVEPADGKVWKAPGAGFSVLFERAPEGGAVTGLTIRAGNNTRRMTLGAAPPEPPVDAAKLAALAGDYRDEATQELLRVVVEGSRLALVRASRPGELTLYAPDEKGWRTLLADPSAAVRFDLASDGTVESCTARLGTPEQVWKRVAPKAGER